MTDSTLRDRLFRKMKRITATSEDVIDDPSCLTDKIVEDILGIN